MKLSSERTVVQNPLIRYATEAGWTYMSLETGIFIAWWTISRRTTNCSARLITTRHARYEI